MRRCLLLPGCLLILSCQGGPLVPADTDAILQALRAVPALSAEPAFAATISDSTRQAIVDRRDDIRLGRDYWCELVSLFEIPGAACIQNSDETIMRVHVNNQGGYFQLQVQTGDSLEARITLEAPPNIEHGWVPKYGGINRRGDRGTLRAAAGGRYDWSRQGWGATFIGAFSWGPGDIAVSIKPEDGYGCVDSLSEIPYQTTLTDSLTGGGTITVFERETEELLFSAWWNGQGHGQITHPWIEEW